jgi:hypothetical protein
VRDELAQEVDAEFEVMGECRLRNIRQPVHAYRVHRKGSVDRIMPILSESDLFPTIAVVPYTPRNRDEDHLSLGEVLAEDLIVSLSRSRELNVISRLSTTGFQCAALRSTRSPRLSAPITSCPAPIAGTRST